MHRSLPAPSSSGTISLAPLITCCADEPWREHPAETLPSLGEVEAATCQADLIVDGTKHQTWEGFGGCFNELGWVALSALDEDAREQVLGDLFRSRRFPMCRVPIGASDYATEWYSHNETDGDLEMRHFTIAHDQRALLPYLRAALRHEPAMQLFASPWSPPTWMKQPRSYNYGTLIWQPEVLQAYALYLHKFVESYRAEGMPIAQIHVQNEPDSDQKFPSCKWTGERMRDFIRDYLGPLFREVPPGGKPCEIWAGTLERGDFAAWAGVILNDEKARSYLSGIGFQWAGKAAVQRAYASAGNLRLLQTENECGDGTNTWEYAGYVFDLAQHYITNGVNGYVYWNMVLPGARGESTWGWTQNAMISVDLEMCRVTYNPEFYVMQLLAATAAPGWKRLGLSGGFAAHAVAFQAPDGSDARCAVRNPYANARALTVRCAESVYHVPMAAHSLMTFRLLV